MEDNPQEEEAMTVWAYVIIAGFIMLFLLLFALGAIF